MRRHGDWITVTGQALVIDAQEPDGGSWMPLFVVPAAGVERDDTLRERTKATIRTGASPHHVPDEILDVPGIPHPRTGKKVEAPIKRLFQGAAVEEVVNPATGDSPGLIDRYAQLREGRRMGGSAS